MVNVKRMVSGVILTILAIVIIFQLVGNTSSTVTDAATNISGSGLPLASLFSSSGIVVLMYMAGILLAVVGIALSISGGKS